MKLEKVSIQNIKTAFDAQILKRLLLTDFIYHLSLAVLGSSELAADSSFFLPRGDSEEDAFNSLLSPSDIGCVEPSESVGRRRRRQCRCFPHWSF